MIIDHIDHSERYYGLGDGIRLALEYLKQTNFSGVEHGDYALDGENMFAKVRCMASRRPEDARWEAHREYADVHYLVEGQEKMGYASAARVQSAGPYDVKKDVYFLAAEGDFFDVPKGYFVLFAPEEIHMPALAQPIPSRIKRVIIKVKMS